MESEGRPLRTKQDHIWPPWTSVMREERRLGQKCTGEAGGNFTAQRVPGCTGWERGRFLPRAGETGDPQPLLTPEPLC